MVICLERGADLHMAQLMPLPLTVSCFSIIQIGFTFLVSAHQGSPGKRAVKRVCVCVFGDISTRVWTNLPRLLRENRMAESQTYDLLSRKSNALTITPPGHNCMV